MKHVDELQALLDGIPVGTLINGNDGKIYFAYEPGWIVRGFALSPMPAFKLQPQPFAATGNPFGGLHGVFNDALPDGWGLLLMDREFMRLAGWQPREIRPLDRLSYMGDRAIGALEFRPVMDDADDVPGVSIAALAEAALSVEEGTPGDVLHALAMQGGSPGGARPKVTLALSDDGEHCCAGFRDTPAGYSHWIVKFRAKETDPVCAGRIEMAYADMAKAAGVIMPETRLVAATVRDQMQHYFAVKRFDREGQHKRHVLSISGMLEASHRVPALDYDTLLEAIAFASKDIREVEKAFRLMVFNVLAHNKDDHVKNFSLVREGNDWKLSPAYDLTFNSGMNNEHMTSVNGRGNPTMKDILTIAKNHGIRSADTIVDQVIAAVRQWPEFASKWQVEPSVIEDYQSALRKLLC